MSHAIFTFVTLRRVALVAALLGCAGAAQAQLAVTGVTYGPVIAGPIVTQGGLTFQEQTRAVASVATSGSDYQFSGPVASNVYTRRNTTAGNANNSSVFYQTLSGSVPIPYGKPESNLEAMWLSNNLTKGILNPLANGNTTTTANIERFDFRLANYTVQAGDALVFFDLASAGSLGGSFRVAAFTSWGTVNCVDAPTAYANTGTLISAGTFGPAVNSPFDGTSGTFIRASTSNGDNLVGTPSIATLCGPLNLVGILIRFSDLGIAAGTTIQGFSIMSGNVAVSNATQLADWNNAAYYPTNSSASTYGNMDFAAFGAQVSRPVPEPATYGVIFTGLALALVAWRRRTIAKAA